jgi:hypothetical protein
MSSASRDNADWGLTVERAACERWQLEHIANDPAAPDWFDARARTWAALSGYETLVAHAGVGGNEGTVYDAAGFDHEEAVAADGSGWLTRDGRTAREDYERHRWVADLREVRP